MIEASCGAFRVFLHTNQYLYKETFINFQSLAEKERSRLAAYLINIYALCCLYSVSKPAPANHFQHNNTTDTAVQHLFFLFFFF